MLVGDKGYLSQQWQAGLFAERQIMLRTPMRKNQVDQAALPSVFRRARKQIETIFS